jgi:hypothetical protein
MPKKRKKSKGGKKREFRPYKIAAHAEFQRGLAAGKTLTSLCAELHIHEATATRWLRAIRMEIIEALDARGLNAHTVAEGLERLLAGRKSTRLQLEALHMLAKLRGMYPREDASAIPPVTLSVNFTNLILPEEREAYEARGIAVRSGEAREHSGDAEGEDRANR